MKVIKQRIDFILKHCYIANKIFLFFGSVFFRFLGLFIRVDNYSILFSAHGRKYNDSPKAIYEYLISHCEYSNFEFYWAVEDNNDLIIPGNYKRVKPDTFKYFCTALRCKYWVTCVNIERGLRFKRKSNIYLNTWHGIPIKTVGNDANNRKDYDFSYVDFFCVSGEYEIDIYKRAFNISHSSFLRTGMPRNDALFNVKKEEILYIKNKLNLPIDKKIILYAPTWRDSYNKGKTYEIKPPIDINMWENKLGKDYILLLRTHPYTNKLLGVNFNNFVLDYTNYPDINDLLKITDILISDYSATIFDFSILERPIICFAYDYENYKSERGFTLNLFDEFPGGIKFNETEVINSICSCDFQFEQKQISNFKNKFIMYGGKATELCIEAMFSKKSDE